MLFEFPPKTEAFTLPEMLEFAVFAVFPPNTDELAPKAGTEVWPKLKPPEAAGAGGFGCWKPVKDPTPDPNDGAGVGVAKLNPPLAGIGATLGWLRELIRFELIELVELTIFVEFSVPPNLKPPVVGATTFVVFPKLTPFPIKEASIFGVTVMGEPKVKSVRPAVASPNVGKADVAVEFPKMLDPRTLIGCAAGAIFGVPKSKVGVALTVGTMGF